jgi:polynucleotide 5'-hydroxyl-kinase GRC3/NOL9
MASMDAALSSVLDRTDPRVILVLGASDTGKTTLIEQLLAEWNTAEAIAVVDCDVGQSHLGPPTTIGWGVIAQPFQGWSHVPVRGIGFTGSVSPEGNLEMFLQVASRVMQTVRQPASRLLVDTTGLVDGELGKTLKRRKAELIKPDLILALQRDQELEELLAGLSPVAIQRVAVSPGCVRRSLAQREAYRNRQFARYFANAAKQTLSLNRVGLIGLGPDWSPHLSSTAEGSPAPSQTPEQTGSEKERGPSGQRPVGGWHTGNIVLSLDALMDRVVGLRNGQGEDLALGLIRDVNPEDGTLTVFTPLRDLSQVSTVCVGSVRWPVPGNW